MRGLLIKEALALRPFWFLIVLIYGADLFFVPLTEFPDQNPLPGSLTLLSDSNWYTMSVLMIVLCLSLSSGLMVNEQDNGTIRFLDGLPTTRTRIFLAKYLVAFLVLYTGPFLSVANGLIFHLFSATSLHQGFYAGLIFPALFLYACQVFLLLNLALLFSFLRRFGWILAACSIFAYLAVHRFFPGVAVLNPIELTRPVFEGLTWVIPWRALAYQMTGGVVILVLLIGLFFGQGFQLSDRIHTLKNAVWGRVALGCGAFAAVGLWIGLLIFWVSNATVEDEGAVAWQDWSTVRVHTDYYLFSIPKYLEQRAEPLISSADEIHNAVAGFLGAEFDGEILVDGTSNASHGYAGLAFWKTIRLSLPGIEDVDALKATLGHETCHVYIDILSDRRMGDKFRWTRFFHEGLSEYLEHRLFKDGVEHEELRFQAAVAFDRDEAKLEVLLDDVAFSAKYDPNLVYALGERFAAAMVDRYGDDSAGAVMRAMGRENGPDLSGLELWRDAFQVAGYNFDDVENRYYELLSKDHDLFETEIQALPRLYGSVIEEGDRIGLKVDASVETDLEIYCQIRQSERTEVAQYVRPISDENGVFWVSRVDFPTMQFQLGLLRGNRVIYEPWTEVSISR